MSDCKVTLRPSGMSLVWALNVRLVYLLVSVEISLSWFCHFLLALVVSVGAASPALARPIQLAPGCDGLLSIIFYSRVTQYPRSGSSWLPPVASQRFQDLVPSFVPVGLLCGGLLTRFLYNLGLNGYHHIKYKYLTVLLYYPIAHRASPIIL